MPRRQTPPSPTRRPRLGPRPLPLHLALEGWMFLGSCAASQRLKTGSPSSNASAPAADSPLKAAERALAERLLAEHARAAPNLPPNQTEAPDLDRLSAAIALEARRRFGTFLDGVQAYRTHPARRAVTDPPEIWRRGAVCLRPYGGAEDAPPVLAVPSLINRAYILDLNGKRSLMRHLARRGLRPFLLDWGWPGERAADDPAEDEGTFTLTDYVVRRVEAAMAEVVRRTGRRPLVVGYCMGGLLSLAACLRRPDLAAGYVALATPWDFHADPSPSLRVLIDARHWVAEVIDQYGELPVDLLQAMFSGLDPLSIARKFRAFGALPTESDKAKAFVALEDWVNDGVPLAGPVARECVLGWYGENTTGRGAWMVDGAAMDPADLRLPSLVIIPAQDRIVPPESARALADRLPDPQRRTVPLGHVGMIAGGKAVREVYGPLARWLRTVGAADHEARPVPSAASTPGRTPCASSKSGAVRRDMAMDLAPRHG